MRVYGISGKKEIDVGDRCCLRSYSIHRAFPMLCARNNEPFLNLFLKGEDNDGKNDAKISRAAILVGEEYVLSFLEEMGVAERPVFYSSSLPFKPLEGKPVLCVEEGRNLAGLVIMASEESAKK